MKILPSFRAIITTAAGLLILGPTLAFFVLNAPGMVSIDDLYLLRSYLDGQNYSEWHSFSYSVLNRGMWCLSGSWIGIHAFNLLLYSGLICLTLIRLHQSNNRRAHITGCLILVLFSLAPFSQPFLFTQNRDTTFSLLLLLICLFVSIKRYWNARELASLSVLIVVTADMRQEAKIYLFLLPLLLGGFKLWPRLQIRNLLLWLIPLSLGFFWGLPSLLNFSSYTPIYQATAYLNPLGEIYHEIPVASLYPKQHEKIAAALDTDYLQTHYTPFEIPILHNGGVRELSPAKWKDFKHACLFLFIHHPDIWLKNRLRNLVALSNITYGQGPHFHKTSTVQEWMQQLKIPESYTAIAVLAHPKQQAKYIEWVSYVFQSENPWIRLPLASLVLPLLILLLVGSDYKTCPRSAFIAWMILVRVPVVCAFAPASQYKYLYSLPLAGSLLGSLWFVEKLASAKFSAKSSLPVAKRFAQVLNARTE